MLTEEKFTEVTQRVMQTVALAGVPEFEQDVMLLIFDLKEARKKLLPKRTEHRDDCAAGLGADCDCGLDG